MENETPTPNLTDNDEDQTQISTSYARQALSMISLEPAIFLGTLGYGLSSIISQVRF